MWATRLANVCDQVVPFNHGLLQNYHEDKMGDIPYVLEALFQQSVRVITNASEDSDTEMPEFKYVGFRELSPEERLDMIKLKKTYETKYSIRKTNKRVFLFMFEYNGKHEEVTVDVPFLDQGKIELDGTNNYPKFIIHDKGGMNRKDNSIILQVMRARLSFWREERSKYRFKTVEGTVYSECSITTKLHHGSNCRKNKETPIVLHHLASFGFHETMKMYGVDDAIELVEDYKADPEYTHYALKNECFIRIKKDRMDVRTLRVLVGLISIYDFHTSFIYAHLFTVQYYILAIGIWAQTTLKSKKHAYKHAKEFMHMNQTILDLVYKLMHATIGIVYDDLNGLLMYMFNNIDDLIADYKVNSNNMLVKKIAGAEMIMSVVIEAFNNRMYDILNSRRNNKPLHIKKLLYHQSCNKAINNSDMFESAPTMYCDNLLAAIGSRQLSLDTSAGSGRGKVKKKKTIPVELLLSHYSYTIACSAFTFPSSNPIVSGSINPYVMIDDHGNILKPNYIDDIIDIYTPKTKEPN